MPNKEKETYEKVWESLIELFDNFNPEICVSDFEDAIRSSLKKVFPGIDLVGCWFHYIKVI